MKFKLTKKKIIFSSLISLIVVLFGFLITSINSSGTSYWCSMGKYLPAMYECSYFDVYVGSFIIYALISFILVYFIYSFFQKKK